MRHSRHPRRGALVLLVAAAVAGCAGPVPPAADGSPVPAACPGSWSGAPVEPSRDGPLVPPGAVGALLCSYPQPGYTLAATRRITDGVGELTGYLNGLATTRPADETCGGGAVTEHAVVLEYADRPPAVVVARNCGYDQSGAVRYHGDIRRITAFWGVTWRD